MQLFQVQLCLVMSLFKMTVMAMTNVAVSFSTQQASLLLQTYRSFYS